ncbi:MAG: glycosyltransferase family 39 protein [Myxococcota bacterium]
MPWWRDRTLLGMLVAGVLLRALPLLIWMNEWGCVRDECTYTKLSFRLAHGEGMTASSGWLWAPGYPFLMALHKLVFNWSGAIRITQIIIAIGVAALLYHLAGRQGGRRAGRWAAALYLFSPTMIFFSQSLWSECIYSALLLLTIAVFDRARQQTGDARGLIGALILGALVGSCMLFRGVATYMLPIFAFGLLWWRLYQKIAWGQAAALFLAAGLTVAPYSLYASKKFDHFIVTDRTIGQMMWLGNNEFEPIAFDWGNGVLSRHAWRNHVQGGRKPCGSKDDPMGREDCQTAAGVQWIKDNPVEFVRRMPLRVAQMLNPHSFVTRHLRWGNFRGLPQWADEVIIMWNFLWSMAVMLGGCLALAARGRDARALLIALLLTYHAAAISVLAGLTRYRVPLEPLLMIYLAGALAEPRQTLAALRQQPVRWLGVLLVVVIIAPLVFWFLPSGWPWWRTW